MDFIELVRWAIAGLAAIVALLTLYNAAKIGSGILAVSTYAFGAGMLCLSTAFLILALPDGGTTELGQIVYHLLFVVGFILLGFGSYKIYKMSKG
ncbi:MAG: hypothetical protein V1808_03360 [Candidatus Daviesbacteria bacterium]